MTRHIKSEKFFTPYENMLVEVHKNASPERALLSSRFFKTGPGEYSEGDIFTGIPVPILRVIAKKYFAILTLEEVITLLQSPEHEYRALALIILTKKYDHGDMQLKEEIFAAYCSNTATINNWDLVDVSVACIVGQHLFTDATDAKNAHTKNALQKLRVLSQSTSVWERRMAIVATHAAIKEAQYEPTYTIVRQLLTDKHDLIHKACGWMLREVGRYCGHDVLKTFLDVHADHMPRTTLRYAIEHFSPQVRTHYMKMRSISRT